MSQIDALPPLRDVLQAHDLMAKKSLGQNFLLDLNLTSRIARTAGALEGFHVVEIGPGPGGLSRGILAQGASHLTVIERDHRCRPILDEISSHYPGKMTIVEADALTFDWSSLSTVGLPIKIIANLPYNVATPLLLGWLSAEPWPPFYHSMCLMFQREVADRIVAQAGDKHFGRISVIAGWRTYATKAFDISPKAFTPPPKVTSTVVHFEPRQTLLPCDRAALERVTAAAFQQRRKMLRSSLKSLGVDAIALLDHVEIKETKRAEELNVEEFVKLANAMTSFAL